MGWNPLIELGLAVQRNGATSLVLLLSAAIFGESLSTAKVAGVILICIGVAISAQGQ